MIRLAGPYAFVATRLIQLLAGFAVVWLSAKVGSRLFGPVAGRASLVFGLFLPTIVFFRSELITETFAMLTAALFLMILLDPAPADGTRRSALTGALIGIASLIRFNFGVLGIVAAWALLRDRGLKRAIPCLAVLAAAFLLVLAPWLARNESVFGRPLLSTQSGLNAIQGILTPQGRAQPGDIARVHAAIGWVAADLETNDPRRLALGPEAELDRRAWRSAWRAWKNAGWHALTVEIEKLGYFWLSTDQLLSTSSFPLPLRMLRAMGVVLSWCALALALIGWGRWREATREKHICWWHTPF